MENINLPPYPFLYQSLERCPLSTLLYIQMWEKRKENNTLQIYFDEITELFYISKTKFLNHLVALAKEGFISISKSKLSVRVEFVVLNDLDRECG